MKEIGGRGRPNSEKNRVGIIFQIFDDLHTVHPGSNPGWVIRKPFQMFFASQI